MWVGNNKNNAAIDEMQQRQQQAKKGSKKKSKEQQQQQEQKQRGGKPRSSEKVPLDEDLEAMSVSSPPPQSSSSLPSSSLPTFNFDRDIFVQRIGELNHMIQADKAKVVTDTAGKRARLVVESGVPVTLFEDGLVVRFGAPHRRWDDAKAQRFVADIMDGFFPGEFKDEYPDGVKLDLKDMRNIIGGQVPGAGVKVFEGKGNKMVSYGETTTLKQASPPSTTAWGGGTEEKDTAEQGWVVHGAKNNVHSLASIGDPYVGNVPMSGAEFLSKLPEKVVGKNGDIYDLRNDIFEKMKGNNGPDGFKVVETMTEKKQGAAGGKSPKKGVVSASEKGRAAADAAEKRRAVAASALQKELDGGDAADDCEGAGKRAAQKPANPVMQKLGSSLRMNFKRTNNNNGEGKNDYGDDDHEETQATMIDVEDEETAKGGREEAMVRVRVDIGDGQSKKLELKMRNDNTVGDLRKEVGMLKLKAGKIEIRTAFPNRVYDRDDETLEAAGLTGGASVIARYLK